MEMPDGWRNLTFDVLGWRTHTYAEYKLKEAQQIMLEMAEDLEFYEEYSEIYRPISALMKFRGWE